MDNAAYQDWINRGHCRSDVITNRLIEEFHATLPDILAKDPVPLGLFWALAPDALAPGDLGRDGHARLGINMPQMPLPRRMWAGGEVSFLGTFRPGDNVVKDSRIEKIEAKTGSTGPLIFISVRYRYCVAGVEIVNERQNLVYRRDAAPGDPVPTYPPAPDIGTAAASFALTSDPVRLFRFSALTFNGHRIH